jgi:integrase
MSVTKRANKFHLRKRVPTRYQSVEPRGTVWISLHTDSETIAKQKADGAWAQMIEAWEAKLAGDSRDAEARFEAARDLAAVRGVRYLPAAKVAELPREDILARVEASIGREGKADPREAIAVLGGVTEPPITVSRSLELYWSLTADRNIGKSEDQLRRWENPRKKAVRNFIEVVEDKPVAEISGDDMLNFRAWWLDKMESEGLTANSANKDLIHLGDVLKTVNKMKRLGLVLPLSDLSFKPGEAKQRPPFSEKWIRDRLLKSGALDGLNKEARGIVLAMVNTGARPSELAALTEGQIRLDDDVPHISIEPIGRQLKSKNARRVIPLLGASLEAMKANPRGFPTYRTSSATLSATVNKFLRTNGLMESDGHSLYGLRHGFEDRLLAAGVDERIRRDLFGHTINRERYGNGATLSHLRDVVHAVAL